MTTSPVAPVALSAPVVLDPMSLSALDARDFVRLTGEVNTAHAVALAAYELAASNLTALLTEQVARRILASHPTARMLFVRGVAEFHYDEDGEALETCDGHDERLMPVEARDEDGIVLVEFDAMHPAAYLLERLTPMLGTEDYVLDLAAREWALDCTHE